MEQLRECEAAGEWSLAWRQRALCIAPGAQPVDPRDVADELSTRYARRREADLARLAELESMLCAPACLNSALETYFTGAPMPTPCGHCPACSSSPPQLPPYPPPQLPPPATELPEFDRPAQRRRFLAGISSPALMARRLWSHPHYASTPYNEWNSL